ncbi:MAG TPA: hypothetical protein VFN99_00460 [Gaiella sp.]|nr:hypothetical protein [Gaiella sp.]
MAMGSGVRRSVAAISAVLAGLLLAAPAGASELIARNASNVRLQADAQGRALISFRSEGQSRQLRAWGAVNARPPSQAQPQVAFKLQYGGTIGPNTCGAYRGPPLAWKVAACTASDGTHWALQAWQRMLPNYGVSASGERAAWELRLSHWSGPLATLEIWTDWSYRRFHHIYGRLTYNGGGVFGFRSTRFGVPLDTYGRNVFVDTFNSTYGAGWKRENSFLTHKPTGGFCYGFYPHGPHPIGAGRKYRATVIGPGVTPDVMWEGSAPGPYDAATDAQANDAQRAVLGADPRCKIN